MICQNICSPIMAARSLHRKKRGWRIWCPSAPRARVWARPWSIPVCPAANLKRSIRTEAFRTAAGRTRFRVSLSFRPRAWMQRSRWPKGALIFPPAPLLKSLRQWIWKCSREANSDRSGEGAEPNVECRRLNAEGRIRLDAPLLIGPSGRLHRRQDNAVDHMDDTI